MGLREKMNKNPLLVAIAGIVAVGLAVWMVYRTATDKGLTMEPPTSYYFTTDDGKNLFSAPVSTVPPFEKDGKTAVRAHVFSCDKGKTQFVGYLLKYKDEFAKQAAAEASQPPVAGKPSMLEGASAAWNTFIKKPGAGDWLPYTSPQASDITAITCPSKDPWDLVEQYPKR